MQAFCEEKEGSVFAQCGVHAGARCRHSADSNLHRALSEDGWGRVMLGRSRTGDGCCSPGEL